MNRDDIKLEIKLPPETPLSMDEFRILTARFMNTVSDGAKVMAKAMQEATEKINYTNRSINDFAAIIDHNNLHDLDILVDSYSGKRGIYRKDGRRIN